MYMKEKKFKELEIILSDFSCDKNCPYCTAKITKWEVVEDDIYMLSLYVGQLKKLGYQFHYVTIGGNGEPTKHSIKKLKEIVELFDDYDIPVKRVLTSGNVFRDEEREKYELFISHGWVFEVTTTSIDTDLDRKVLGYNYNYFQSNAFSKARIRLNYVLLKSNFPKVIDEVHDFFKKYPNIETISLKLLNINTKNGLIDNPYSSWIVENAISKDQREEVKTLLDQNFTYLGEVYDTFSWKADERHEVYFSWKKMKYGFADLVYYGNHFVNYQLDDVKLPLLPKIYFASQFYKKMVDHKYFTLKDDFRTKLIGSEADLTNFNNHSFIRNKDGKLLYQYLGPFYNEKASDGSLTSTVYEDVVQTENNLIDKCDIFMTYFDSNISPGSVTELIYASLQKKKILIFYKIEDSVSYDLKTSNWYPIVFSRLIDGRENVVEIPVHRTDELIEYFQEEKIIW